MSLFKKKKKESVVFTPVEIPAPLKPEAKEETLRVAGVSFRKKEIESLAKENYEYDLSKRELIDEGLVDEKVWEYDFFPEVIELIPEPDNEEDPNAVKVVIDGAHVGYIKSGKCTHVKKLLAADKILNISAEITGGKYKYVREDYDDYKDKETYELETGETDSYSIALTLKIKE